MRVSISRAIVAGALLMGGAAARAQEPGLGGLLGGYGAMAGPSASMGGGFYLADPSGMGGSIVIPAAGGSVGAMGMSSMRGGGLSFRRVSPTAMSPARRPSLSLDSMGGMPRMGGAMGARRGFTLSPGTISAGVGLGGGMRRMPAGGGMGVMPPSIGYPFRQPPSLLVPSAPGAGMSM